MAKRRTVLQDLKSDLDEVNFEIRGLETKREYIEHMISRCTYRKKDAEFDKRIEKNNA